MTHLHAELLEALAPHDSNPTKKLECYSIGSAVGAIAREKFGDEIPQSVRAEWMALNFCPDYRDKPNGWGTYFGPMSVLQGDDGEWRESPSIQSVDETVIDYWLGRAEEATHPILRARYADLVWDLSKPGADRKPPITALRTAVDEYLKAARTVEDVHPSELIKWSGRALELAVSVADEERLNRAVETILDLARQTDAPRMWRFAHGVLFHEKKVNGTDAQKELVLDALTRHADTELEDERVLPFQGGEVSLMLAEHFWVNDEHDAAQKLAKRYGDACMPVCDEAMAMLACDWLTKLENLFRRYRMTEDAERVAALLVERSKGIKDNLVHQEHRQEIDMRPLDEAIDRMLDRELPEAVAVFWNEFVPQLEDVREQAKSRHSGFIMSFFGARHVDGEGRVTRAMPSYQEDPEAYLPLAYSQHLEFWAFFLERALDRFREKFSPEPDDLLAVLELSPLFGDHNRILLQRGLKAYLEDDYVAAVHVLVPTIEAALRTLLQGLGRPVWRVPRRGSDEERHVVLLDELLRDPALEEYLKEDSATYLRMLLSDRRGWNVRNNVCHGLLHGDSFGRMLSDRLVHVLFGLGLVRGEEGKKAESEEPGGEQKGD